MGVTNFDIVTANEFRGAMTADTGSVGTDELANLAVTTAKIAANNVTAAKIERADTAGKLLIGQGASADAAWTAVGGDATLAGNGALTIANNAVSLAKFSRGDSTGKILVAQGASADAQWAAVSGDATLSGAGAVTIANGAVSSAKMATGARTRTAVIPFSLPATTGSDQLGLERAIFTNSQAYTITSVKLVSTVTTSGSDGTNRYEVKAKNKSGSADLHTGPTVTQSNEITAYTPWTIAATQNLSFTANQVFEVVIDIKDDGSAAPTSLAPADLSIILEYTI